MLKSAYCAGLVVLGIFCRNFGNQTFLLDTAGFAIFEREFWRAKICAGHLGPANFEAGVSEKRFLGSNLKLANLRA